MNKSFSICIGICTKDRPKKVRLCLSSLSLNKGLIDEIVVTEDISNSQNISKKYLQKKFPSVKRIKYIKNRFNSISKSRNILLKNIKSDILIMIDDDTIISKNMVHKVINHFLFFSKTGVVTGRILPIKMRNNVSIAESYYISRERLFFKSIMKMNYTPFTFVAINMKYINKYNLYFNEELLMGEDIDFSLKITRLKIPIYFSGKIKNYHYNNTSLKSYLFDRLIHGKYYVLLNNLHKKRYPINNISNYNNFPIILFPFLSIANAYKILKDDFPKIKNIKVYLILFLSEIVSVLSTSYFQIYNITLLLKSNLTKKIYEKNIS